MSKQSLQEAGAGMEGLHTANCYGKLLCTFIFLPSSRSGAFTVLSALWSFREEGRVCVFPYSRDPGRPMVA